MRKQGYSKGSGKNRMSLGKILKFSSDRNEAAWAFYLKYYRESLLKNEKKEFIFSHGSMEIQVNGDVSFNIDPALFNGNSKLYESILNGTNVSDELIDSLKVMRYSPMNISILPMTGALNNIKKSLGNDRFDTFVYFMNQYYEGVKVPIINAGSINMGIGNRLILENFLDSYNSALEFFEDIYGLEKHFVNKLIKSGKRTITKEEDYCYYLKLAHDYWNSRLSQKKIQDYLDKRTIEKYQNHLNTISNEIEIVENNINKQ